MKQIFLYIKDENKKKEIMQIARMLGINTRELMPSQLGLKTGYITGIIKKKEKPANIPFFYNMPELILFYGMDDMSLDTFLAAYKMAGIDPVSLKAVLTTDNCKWSLYELIEELRRERDYISQ